MSDASMQPEEILPPGFLAVDERIVWQGQPSNRWQFEWWMIPAMLVFFAALANSSRLLPMIFDMFSYSIGFASTYLVAMILFLIPVFGLFPGVSILSSRMKSSTRYILTDRRAIVYGSFFGRSSFSSIPIDGSTVISLKQHRQGTVVFGSTPLPFGALTLWSANAFIGLESAKDVFDLVMKVQNGKC